MHIVNDYRKKSRGGKEMSRQERKQLCLFLWISIMIIFIVAPLDSKFCKMEAYFSVLFTIVFLVYIHCTGNISNI
jgi:cell division protein FtsW (lipid II flippase)